MQNCYNTGERIPREKQYGVDEKLSSKHIQTLQFVQEVVNENKVLKKRVQELEEDQLKCGELHTLAEESKVKIKVIQEQYLKRADEINAMMAEKHRGEMMKLVQEKLEQEQKYREDIAQVKTEISKLEDINRELLSRATELKGSHTQDEIYVAEIEDQKRIISNLQMELETLRSENEQISDENNTQFSHIQSLQSLKDTNESLAQDVKSLTCKNIELLHKVIKLEADLKDASSSRNHEKLINKLKTKLALLHKQCSIADEKEEHYQKLIGDFKNEVEQLKRQLQNAELTKDHVLEEYHNIHAELQNLKKHAAGDSDNKNFRDFVQLKREVANLKDENLHLKQMNKSVLSSDISSFPMLKFAPDVDIKGSSSMKGSKSKKVFGI